MKHTIGTMLIIIGGIIMIPSLFCMAFGLAATVIAFLMNPRVIGVILLVLGILCVPGIIIGWLAKR